MCTLELPAHGSRFIDFLAEGGPTARADAIGGACGLGALIPGLGGGASHLWLRGLLLATAMTHADATRCGRSGLCLVDSLRRGTYGPLGLCTVLGMARRSPAEPRGAALPWGTGVTGRSRLAPEPIGSRRRSWLSERPSPRGLSGPHGGCSPSASIAGQDTHRVIGDARRREDDADADGCAATTGCVSAWSSGMLVSCGNHARTDV